MCIRDSIQSYYEQRTDRMEIENDTREADIVSARIAKLLGEKAFQFSPAEWLTIHRRLFEGVFPHAGQIRQYNITKKEWVLKGATVTYAAWNSIKDTLDYDFATEKQFSYGGLSVERSVKHLAKFASDIWQIHPFCEGNTRATAVFMIKYMKTFGLDGYKRQRQCHDPVCKDGCGHEGAGDRSRLYLGGRACRAVYHGRADVSGAQPLRPADPGPACAVCGLSLIQI